MRLKALIIDDARVMRMLLHAWLAQLGVSVVEAGTGEAGLRAFSEHRFDVVFCDVNLPGISGLAVVKTIRGGARHADIPIVVLTTMGRDDDVSRGHQLGASHYLTKPLDFDALADTIRSIRAPA